MQPPRARPRRDRDSQGGGPTPFQVRRRLVGLAVVFGILLLLAVGKIADLQVVTPGRYVNTGLAQRMASVALPASRGAILDRNGNDLAVSVPLSTVVVDPTLVEHPNQTAATLAPVLGVTPASLMPALTRKGTRFAYLARLVPDDVAARIEKLMKEEKLRGVDLISEFKRLRPDGDVALPVVGGTNADGSGASGLEAMYNAQLLGHPGELRFEQSPMGPVAGGKREMTPSVAGRDLQLTIDRDLQYQVDELTEAQVKRTGAKGGIVVVSKPSTGEILAMTHVVADPKTGEASVSSNNAAVTTVFEPGSVNKVITVSGALEEGVATPATVLETPPHLQLGGATFGEAEALPGHLSVTEVLTVSSNIGTIQLGKKLGKDRIDSYLRRFGFGSKTALRFPNESAGLLLAPKDWSGSSLGSIPIGQGISVTPLQMLMAYNVIANDGMYVPPRLLSATIDGQGVTHDEPLARGHRVVSAKTARSVRGMLTTVVRAGTGQKAAVSGYQVAGKTGTARKPLDEHAPGNGYLGLDGAYHYVSTFVGMVPSGEPALSIIVVLDEPDPAKSYYASDTAAPLFSEIARVALRRFHIPPSTAGDPTVGLPAVAPDLLSATASEPAVGPGAPTSTTVPTAPPSSDPSEQTATSTTSATPP